MPVELTIVETELSLGQTVAEVILESTSAPGPAGPGVPAGGTDGQVLTKTSATDYATAWEDPTGGGGGGAPLDATYLVTTADGDLTAEVVVGATPGGELGGTWASPTVDASHSGSTHAAVQAAAEATAAAALSAHLTDTSDAHDASAISIADAGNDFTATDVEGALDELQADHEADAAALTTHEADTTSVHGIADTSALALSANVPSNATFNDHSARHEDGGADEISLTGLSGTPAALTTHEADTTSVHGIADTSALALTANHPSNATFNDHSARHEDGGADEISLTGLSGDPADTVNKSLYDANTVLAANSDNTPAAVTMAASTILARLASGNIKAASVAEILTLLDVPTNAQAILDALLDAKGDLIVASAADTPARLAVGTNGHVLTADSAEATGVKWAAAAGGGGAMELIHDETLGSDTATFDVSGISGSYKHLKLILVARVTTAAEADSILVRFNNDSGNNYDRLLWYHFGGGGGHGAVENMATSSGYLADVPGNTASADRAGVIEAVIANYAGTTWQKDLRAIQGHVQGTGTTKILMENGYTHWRSTAAITRITLLSGGSFKAGSRLTIYGLN